MTRAEIVEKSKFQPTDMVDTEIGKVVWSCHDSDRVSFRSTEFANNVVNRVEMRIRVEFKKVNGAWSRQYLSASRIGSLDDISWAAREKIERVLLAAAAKLFTPAILAQANAASAWGDAQRKVGEIAECHAKLAKLENEHEGLMVAWAKSLDAFEEVSA